MPDPTRSRPVRDVAPRSFGWPVPVAVAVVCLVVYLRTLYPAVGLIDSGELAAGCRMLDILHPTGYPLYTALGRLASLLPLGTVANRVAGLSALLAAAGAGLFTLLCRRLQLTSVAAGVCGLVLAFSYPVWSIAVDTEVFGLTVLLLGCLWLAAEAADRGRGLLIFGYLCGLTLTNHMSGASAVAGAGLAALLAGRARLARRIPALLLVFGLGLSPYIFLIVRAHAGPLFAWGNPYSLERFWWHVTGRQYQVWMFSLPLADVLRNAGRGALLVGSALEVVLVPAALYGAVRLFRRRPGLAAGLTLSAVLSFAYAANYSIPDIEAYYIPCVAALAVFAAAGIDGLARHMGRWQYALWVCGLAAFCLNIGRAGGQGDYVAYDRAVNTLASAGPNATIMTDVWDFYAPAFYLQHVEKVRPDVCIVDRELLRRSWYFGYLERQYPWLVQKSRPEIDEYLGYLDQFEHGRLSDPGAIQRCYIAMMRSFVQRSPARPAYTTYDAEEGEDARQMLAGFRYEPVGLLYELLPDSTLPSFDYSRLSIRLPGHQVDDRTRANLDMYRHFVARRAGALIARGRTEEARELVDWYRGQPLNRLLPMPALE